MFSNCLRSSRIQNCESFPHSWLITGFITRSTRRVPLVEQELLTLPVFRGVRVTRSLVLCVCFVDRCLSFCTFSFGHCVVYSSSIYGFWLPLWYLQTLPVNYALWRITSICRKNFFDIMHYISNMYASLKYYWQFYIKKKKIDVSMDVNNLLFQ